MAAMNQSIADHILDGAIVVESADAFESIVKQIPDHPHLHRIYADLLGAKNKAEAAACHYALAVEACLAEGKLLPAMLSKARQWMIARPSRADLRAFHRKLDAAESDGTPASEVVKGLSPAERMALFARVELLCLPPGTEIRKPGEPENALWAVVAGRLKESNYETVDQKPRNAREPVRILKEGEFFGDVYPFSSDILSRSCIEAVTRVELVSFSRRRLIQISRKHPNLEQVVLALCRVRFRPGSAHAAAELRQGERYEIPVRMRLEIAPCVLGEAPLVITGRSRDLSLSGLSFIPESSPAAHPAELKKVVGRKVKVTLPLNDFSLTVGGRLARVFQVSQNGRKTTAVGVRFSEIPLSLRGAFFSIAGNHANGAGPLG
jgi:CRP-like cAMP-binding protein